MRRLALLLAASILGTGCFIGTNDCVDGRTLTVDWQQFIPATGPATTSCGAAGVSWIEVYMDGRRVGSGFDCAAGGVTITGVGSARTVLTVEALDAAPPIGRIIYRHEFTATPASCGDAFYVAEPGEGLLDLRYAFTPTNACTTGGSYMWFQVFDGTADAVSALVDETTAPQTYACGIGGSGFGDLVFAVPESGSLGYQLDWFEERQPVTNGYAVTAADCSTPVVSVSAGQTTVVPRTLVDTTTACPAPVR